jgi:hypothetical protein
MRLETYPSSQAKTRRSSVHFGFQLFQPTRRLRDAGRGKLKPARENTHPNTFQHTHKGATMSQKNPSNRLFQTFMTVALTSSLLSSFSAQATALAEVDSGYDPAKYGFAFENVTAQHGYSFIFCL